MLETVLSERGPPDDEETAGEPCYRCCYGREEMSGDAYEAGSLRSSDPTYMRPTGSAVNVHAQLTGKV